MRALLIDPEARAVTEVEYSGHYRHIYELIGCQTFTLVQIPTRPLHTLYVDDEGLLKDNYFFGLDGYPQPLAGKGLVLRSNLEGHTMAATISADALDGLLSWQLTEGPIKSKY